MDQYDGLENEQNCTILFVDDDQDTCTLLETLFQANGYNTKSVNNGQQALQYVSQSQPDAVVLDIMMPEMDGWETFTKMRSQSDIPVLFLTAITSLEYANHAVNFGSKDYIQKPFSCQELLTRVESILRSDKQNCEKLGLGMAEDSCLRDAVTVVIPAYNEERFIGSTVLKVRKYVNSVIVVDDGSNDNTAKIAESAGAMLIRHTCNQGKAAALNTGFCKALEVGAQVVVTLDADGQHLPEELLQVARPVINGEADIVIGSRYLQQHSNVPHHRIWGHWFFNQLTGFASGCASTDSQSGYRAFSSVALETLNFCSKGFSVESEMQFLAHEKGLRLQEVPVRIQYTDKAKRSVIGHGLSVLGGVFKLMGQYRPLFYFGLPGLIFLLLGLIWALGVLVRYNEVHQLAIGNALISILATLIGVVLFSTGFTLHSIRGLLSDMLRKKDSR